MTAHGIADIVGHDIAFACNLGLRILVAAGPTKRALC